MQSLNAFRVVALTHATCDQHPTVFLHRLTNGLQRFGLGTVDEATGIDDDNGSVLVTGVMS